MGGGRERERGLLTSCCWSLDPQPPPHAELVCAAAVPAARAAGGHQRQRVPLWWKRGPRIACRPPATGHPAHPPITHCPTPPTPAGGVFSPRGIAVLYMGPTVAVSCALLRRLHGRWLVA